MVDLVLLFTAVCLPVGLSVCLPGCLSVCLPVSLPEGPFVHFDTLEAVCVAEFDVVGQLAETR